MHPYTPFRRTDLALEAAATTEIPKEGIEYREENDGGVTLSTVRVTSKEAAAAIGKPLGSYITVAFPELTEHADAPTESAVIRHIEETLRKLMPSPMPQRLLVIGLGNRSVTADALGPFVQERLQVSGHLPEALFEVTQAKCRLYAFAPGVAGKTGIETLQLVQGAVNACRPDTVVVIDALVAAGVERLGRTVQLADTGLIPGSGIGNHRAALNKETLGVPVIAIGAPLVVSSATLICDALNKAGIDSPNDALIRVLETGKSFFVTVKDCDLTCEKLASYIAEAVNRLMT